MEIVNTKNGSTILYNYSKKSAMDSKTYPVLSKKYVDENYIHKNVLKEIADELEGYDLEIDPNWDTYDVREAKRRDKIKLEVIKELLEQNK